MSTSLAARLVRAEAELREQQKVAAKTFSPWDIFDTVAEADFDRFIMGQYPRPVLPAPPPGADLDQWNRQAKFVEALLDVQEGKPIPSGFQPELHAILVEWQRKRASGELFEKDEPDPPSPSMISTAQPGRPSRTISHSDNSLDPDFIFEDLP